MKYHREKTLILVKPDGLMRGLVGEVIKRFESRGLRLAALKMTRSNAAHIRKHYLSTKTQLEGMGGKTLENLQANKVDPVTVLGTDDPIKIGQIINRWNVQFLSSGPVVAMVFEGLQAVEMGRKIVGHTLPSKAEIGTIRGDFSVDSPLLANYRKRPIRNLVHASGTPSEAQREIKHWFKAKELYLYKRADHDLLF